MEISGVWNEARDGERAGDDGQTERKGVAEDGAWVVEGCGGVEPGKILENRRGRKEGYEIRRGLRIRDDKSR